MLVFFLDLYFVQNPNNIHVFIYNYIKVFIGTYLKELRRYDMGERDMLSAVRKPYNMVKEDVNLKMSHSRLIYNA